MSRLAEALGADLSTLVAPPGSQMPLKPLHELLLDYLHCIYGATTGVGRCCHPQQGKLEPAHLGGGRRGGPLPALTCH